MIDILEHYKTVLDTGEYEIYEKKSRFIATIQPVKTEEEAKQCIEEIKKKHRGANHTVFAYQIGERDELQRFSDDGEPQGTAGLPILNVLQGEALKNVLVAVTRYFGGTLLGTGGLVRAYGKAAKEGLIATGIVTLQLYQEYSITINYTDSGKVKYEILQDGHILHNTLYTDNVEFIVLVEFQNIQSFEKKSMDMFRGETCFKKEGLTYKSK